MVTERVTPADLDARLLAGTLDADLAGTGVATASRSRIPASLSDAPFTGVMHYAALDTKVAPFDDLQCRRAVQYAVDRTALQAAYGGPLLSPSWHGAESPGVLPRSPGPATPLVAAPATSALPPPVTGYVRSDPYPADPGTARRALAGCGRAGGFTTSIAVRSDRPGDVAAASVLSRSLARIGVTAPVMALSPFQWGGTAGRPDYVHAHRIGILIDDQAADWPTGYGFLAPVADGAAIAAVNNRNLMELADPTVDRLLSDGQMIADPASRSRVWERADRAVMATAAFVPLADEKVLLYRSPDMANVMVQQAYGMYDYGLLRR